ncbi:MAG TPA: hypothetical protein VNK52_17470 [Hyphomicrobiaceae bacterium]|nr:hypothetical protein [Hyphomicrobiaceae bacterium]
MPALEAVLETLEYLRWQPRVWLEITTLLIPGYNDSAEEVRALSEWVMTKLGPDVPLHFTAFHPDYRMLDVPHTSPGTLKRARSRARWAFTMSTPATFTTKRARAHTAPPAQHA